jgi:tetratricopeptide (TPR) repeat protein
MNTKLLILIAILAVVLIAVALLIHFSPAPADCSFSGWKRTIGVDLEVAVSDVQSIKGKVGISDDQVRDFDTLMRDFALKYDAACNDFTHKRMNQGEYSCRRKNMDDTLDKVRFFLEKVKAAKNLADPATQRDIILRALADLEEATKHGYATGCTSAMNVAPRKLIFEDHASEHSVQISNSGNNDISFSVADVPRGFVSQPPSGAVSVGQTVSVALFRTYEPVTDNPPITFHLRDNFQDDVLVEIQLEQQNVSLYDDLAGKLKSVSIAQNRTPTVDDALKIVDGSIPKSSSWSIQNLDSMRYFLAAGVLSRAGRASEAHQALDTATAKNPALASQPSTLILRGVVVNREGRPEEALMNFEKAYDEASGLKSRKETRALTDLLSGGVAYKTNKGDADKWLSDKDVQDSIRRNPEMLRFASDELRVKDLDKAVEKAAAQPAKPQS